MASRDECNNNASRKWRWSVTSSHTQCFSRSCLSVLVPSPHSDTNPLIYNPPAMGHAKQWRRGKNERTRKKRSWFPLAVSALAESIQSSSFCPSISSFFPRTPFPHPQRLAPVVVLCLAVGFMEALAGPSGMPSWRGDLMRPGMWGSMEMCRR